jgi:transposase
MKLTRSSRRLKDTAQRPLSLPCEAVAKPSPQAEPKPPERFAPERELFFGDETLERYLRHSRQFIPLLLKPLVRELDYSRFSQVKPNGRRPIHPRVLIGVLLYGCLQGNRTLRGLERLALLDLGAMFLCGGLQPDHSTFGKFFEEYKEVLSDEFFETAVKGLIKRLKISKGLTAIDATVIQAACSSYRSLKLEAARQYAEKLTKKLADTPGDAALQQRAQLAQQALANAEARAAAVEELSKDPAAQRSCPTEPEAVPQPLKQTGYAPAYKPSVIVHESGLIIAQTVHASSEIAVVPGLLDQQERVLGKPDVMLGDAGYSNETALNESVRRDLNFLCPSGRESTPGMRQQSRDGKFRKEQFAFDTAQNVYRCPAEHLLRASGRLLKDAAGRTYQLYRAPKTSCAQCALRPQCTKDSGRSIKRYAVDEHKEAMAEILKHPQAKADYARRKAIVEPGIGRLKRQGLTRFLRRGLAGVKLEFSMHSLAHNFGVVIRKLVAQARAKAAREGRAFDRRGVDRQRARRRNAPQRATAADFAGRYQPRWAIPRDTEPRGSPDCCLATASERRG